ncbi:carbohydrate-binding domain-containing protein [Spirosoma aureum]|uniref:Carbohydrate-binding domain-containing protein n=1 Tax=Spirosoma aureum TaxID=2692134 RepID=A0A6G9AMN9_9BACT|nr:carbohydrate-binding domain-containing protein [Spirosoma aureum]QIP13741.1 carbohydrate-binding domain-containing protein [Spirosoma aureum]
MKASLFLLFVLYATTTYAIRYEFGDQVTISLPLDGDLYVAGGTVTINAPIRGDLIAVGGTITVNDSVTNDILLVGGTVILNGYVGDDIRCLGGSLQVLKGAGGDAILGGGTVTIDRDGIIDGSLLSAGGKMIISGQIMKEVVLTFGSLVLEGRVGETLRCQGATATLNGRVNGNAVISANEFNVGPNARFGQEVRYWRQKGKLAFGHAAPQNKIRFDNSLAIETGQGRPAILAILWFLSMALLMIYLIQYFFGNLMKAAGKTLTEKALPSVGAGFLFFIAVPVITVLAYATLVGVLLGVILTFAYIVALMLAMVITSVVAANVLSIRSGHQPWRRGRLVLTAFGVFILIQSLAMVPFIGWLATLLLVTMAFGAILLNINWKQPTQITTAQIQPALS